MQERLLVQTIHTCTNVEDGCCRSSQSTKDLELEEKVMTTDSKLSNNWQIEALPYCIQRKVNQLIGMETENPNPHIYCLFSLYRLICISQNWLLLRHHYSEMSESGVLFSFCCHQIGITLESSVYVFFL